MSGINVTAQEFNCLYDLFYQLDQLDNLAFTHGPTAHAVKLQWKNVIAAKNKAYAYYNDELKPGRPKLGEEKKIQRKPKWETKRRMAA